MAQKCGARETGQPTKNQDEDQEVRAARLPLLARTSSRGRRHRGGGFLLFFFSPFFDSRVSRISSSIPLSQLCPISAFPLPQRSEFLVRWAETTWAAQGPKTPLLAAIPALPVPFVRLPLELSAAEEVLPEPRVLFFVLFWHVALVKVPGLRLQSVAILIREVVRF